MPAWIRVTPKKPCPICAKPQWCMFAPEGDAVLCMRVESAKPCKSGGWIHKIGEAAKEPIKRPREEKVDKSIDWKSLVDFYCKAMTATMLANVARDLGLTADSLRRLRCGWDGAALTFPMYSGKCRPVGIRRRFPDASKRCVEGSKEGLFVPVDLNGEAPVYVTEGPSDCAALLTLGLPAVGRPSCTGGLDYLVTLLANRPCVLIPDGDAPGSPAYKATERFVNDLREFRIDVRVLRPPVKDCREWLAKGLKRSDLE